MELTGNAAKNDVTRAFYPAEISRLWIANFMDETACREWIINRLHPEGPRCPGCSARITGARSLMRFFHGDRLRCGRCSKFFTALTGSFLSGAHLSFRRVILLAILLDVGATDANIARLVRISVEGVKAWRERFSGSFSQGDGEVEATAKRGARV